MAKSLQDYDEEAHKLLLAAIEDDNCAKITEILKSEYDVNAAHPETKETALMEACRWGCSKATELLMSKGADPNRTNKSGRTALHVAVENKNTPCIKILLKSKEVLVDLPDSFGATPLMLAAHRGYREGLMVLLDHGCDLELKNEFGWTALHYSVIEFEKQVGQNKVSCLKELVKSGSDMDTRSKGGYTPLHSAIQMGYFDSVKALVHENCDTDIDAQSKTSGDAAKAAEGAAKAPAAPPRKTLPMTPLSMSLYFGNMPIAELLINYDCSIKGLWDIPAQVRNVNTFLKMALAPKTLKQMCRKTLRKALGQCITVKVEKLGLSESLKNYILCQTENTSNQ